MASINDNDNSNSVSSKHRQSSKKQESTIKDNLEITDRDTASKRLRSLENYVELRYLQIEELTRKASENDKEIAKLSKVITQLTEDGLKIKESLSRTFNSTQGNPDNARIREQLNFQAAEMNRAIRDLKSKRRAIELNKKDIQHSLEALNCEQQPSKKQLLMKDRMEVDLREVNKHIAYIENMIEDAENERDTGEVTMCVFDGKADSIDVARKKDQVCFQIKMKNTLIQKLKKDLFEVTRYVSVLETSLQKTMDENPNNENARIKGLLKSQIEEKIEQINRMDSDLINSKCEVENARNKLDVLKSSHGHNENSFRVSEALFEFNQRNEYFEQLQNRKIKAKSELSSIQSIIQEAENDVFETTRKINIMNLQVEKTNEEISRKKEEIFENEKVLQSLHEQASKLNKQSVFQNRKVTVEKEKEKDILLQKERTIVGYQSRIDSLKKENNEIELIKKKLEQQIENDKIEIDKIVKTPVSSKMLSIPDENKVKDILTLQIEQKNVQIANTLEELTDALHDLESISAVVQETENSLSQKNTHNRMLQKLNKQKSEKDRIVNTLKQRLAQLQSELEFIEITRMKEQVGFYLEQPLLRQLRHLKNSQFEAEKELVSLRNILLEVKEQSDIVDVERLKEKLVVLLKHKTTDIESIKRKRIEVENQLDALGVSLMKDYCGLKLTKYLRSHIEQLTELSKNIEREIDPLKSLISVFESTHGSFRFSQVKEETKLSIDVKERLVEDLKDSIAESQHDIDSLEIILMKDQMCFQIMQRKRHIDRITERHQEADTELQALKAEVREAAAQSELQGTVHNPLLDQLSVQLKLMHEQRDRMAERLEEEQSEVEMYREMLLKLSRKAVSCHVSFAKSFSAHFEGYLEQMDTFVAQLAQREQQIKELKQAVLEAESNAEYYRTNMYELAHESAEIDSQLAVMTSRASNAEKELKSLLLLSEDSDAGDQTRAGRRAGSDSRESPVADSELGEKVKNPNNRSEISTSEAATDRGRRTTRVTPNRRRRSEASSTEADTRRRLSKEREKKKTSKGNVSFET